MAIIIPTHVIAVTNNCMSDFFIKLFFFKKVWFNFLISMKKWFERELIGGPYTSGYL